MANTYHKITIHTIFAVKYRKGMIQPEWEGKRYAVIGNLINQLACPKGQSQKSIR